jgi:hypothetical protein
MTGDGVVAVIGGGAGGVGRAGIAFVSERVAAGEARGAVCRGSATSAWRSLRMTF